MDEVTAPGWHPDPTGAHEQRYWDGSAWTKNVFDQPPVSPGAARTNTAAVAALVLGIVAAFFGVTVLFFWLAWILGVVAFVYGRIGRRRAEEGLGRDSMATAGWILGLVAFVLGIGGFALLRSAEHDSVSSRLDRVDTANGIKVTVTSCEAKQLAPTEDGIPQTVYAAKGSVENTSGDPRVGVKVHVSFRDGDKEFYGGDLNDVYSFGGIDDQKEAFSFSVTLSDEVTNLHCMGSPAS
jgi:hypothetical protein